MSVGGVEPETVKLWRFCVDPECAPARWRSSIRMPQAGEYSMETETREFVPLSSLRLVEEELRQARKALDRRTKQHAKLMREHGLLRADRDRLAVERNEARRLAENYRTNYNLVNPLTSGSSDPLPWEAALSPVQGEHEQDGEDAGVVGDSALPGESVRGAIDPALIRASATDAVAKRDAIRRRLARLDNGEYSVLEMVDDLESLLRHPLWEQCHQAAQDVERLSDEIAAVRNDDSEATR